MEISEQERHERLSRVHTPILLRESSSGDDRREARFYGDFEVVADDGRTLYSVRLRANGSLEISAGGYVQHGGVKLTNELAIRVSGGSISIRRDVYEG